MWLRIFEVWLTARLLASPTFHKAVQNVHKRVRQIRHGKDAEDMGGANVDSPSDTKRFVKYYIEELKEQLRGGQRKS